MAKVMLRVQDEVFEVEKEVLCKHSDYFRAMFSGNYKENQEIEVPIDMLEPNIMRIIVQYVISGETDLKEQSLCTISDIAAAADYLVMTDLTKHVEETLYKMDLCQSNWMEVMVIAENFSFLNVEQLCAAFGVYSFRSVTVEQIPTIQKLAWYLSHPYLDCDSELDVFKFGLQWILNNGADADALLILLACLDYTRVEYEDLQDIQNCIKEQEFVNCLAAKIVDCFFEITANGLEISESLIIECKSKICEMFTEQVWAEAVDLTRESRSRLLYYTPVVCTSRRINFFCIYKPCSGIFKKWLDVMNELENWRMTSWGLTKLVVLYKDLKKDDESTRRITVYDTLRKEWEFHNVCMDIVGYTWTGALAVVNDFLYIVGGRNDIRKSYAANVIEYDLKKKTYRELDLVKTQDSYHDTVCSHKGKLYTVIRKSICRYENTGYLDYWKHIITIEDTILTCMTSHKEYIYCIFYGNIRLFRFNPDVEKRLKIVTDFSYIPSLLISTGNKLLAFPEHNGRDLLIVEEYKDNYDRPKLEETNIHALDTNAGFCALAMSIPPLYKTPSDYINKYLKI